jgi:hypothetical protein
VSDHVQRIHLTEVSFDKEMNCDTWTVSVIFSSPVGEYPQAAFEAYESLKRAVPTLGSAVWNQVDFQLEEDLYEAVTDERA